MSELISKLWRLLSLLILVGASPQLLSQTAVFQDGVLTVPQGAAMVDGEILHYSNIRLAADSDGRFTLLDARSSSLVYVDTVAIEIAESLPVQVRLIVTGSKSVPCVELMEPAVIFNEATFKVALGETSMGPAETCIAMLDPFEVQIPLDVTGLGAGSYAVSVNGVEGGFSL